MGTLIIIHIIELVKYYIIFTYILLSLIHI